MKTYPNKRRRLFSAAALTSLLPQALPRALLSFSAAWGGEAASASPSSTSDAANAPERRRYAQALPSYSIQLPQDHGAHPRFKTEWWYFTAWVYNAQGQPRGLQFTLFRSAPDVDTRNPSRFAAQHLLMGHAAIALPTQGHLVHTQAIGRTGSADIQFKNTAAGLSARLDRWALSTQPDGSWHARVKEDDCAFDLIFTPTQTPWLQGDKGFSKKGKSLLQASHYITLPHMKVNGTVRTQAGQYALSETVTGQAWMDHEWSSTVLDSDSEGWDWVGLHGEDGSSLMAFVIRQKKTLPGERTLRFSHGALRKADGVMVPCTLEALQPLRTWRSSKTGTEYPVSQRLILRYTAPPGPAGVRTPSELKLDILPLMDDQELDARSSTGMVYWEGAVRVLDSNTQKPWGKGYLELTGYAKPMQL